MDWIREHLTESWLALAVVLGVAEMFSLDLLLIMLATGALAGMVTSLVVPSSLAIQAAVAIIVSVGMLAVVRPGIARRLHSGPGLQTGHGKLVGTQGTVTQTLTAQEPGRIRLSGEIWSARPYDETLTIEPGETVEVFEIRGATAYVHPLPQLDP